MTDEKKKLRDDALNYVKEFERCCKSHGLENVDAEVVFEAVLYAITREREIIRIRGEP